MRVCYFGKFDPNYARNRVFIQGLKKNGVEVIECNSDRRGLFSVSWDLIKKHRQLKDQYDVMVVGFLGHTPAILASFITKKPIAFNALISLYDSTVFDRKNVSPRSWRALYYWLLDKLSCQLVDLVILDTATHIDYFVRTFRLPTDKFQRVFVGSDEETFFPFPAPPAGDKFLVNFHGTFIPLHGAEYIVEAAHLLKKENIHFNLIGRGQTYKEIQQLIVNRQLSNVSLIDYLGYLDSPPFQKLKKYLAEADICLGIFGNTQKASNVIPNKVFEILAMGKPLLTGDSPASREILTDRVNVLFCKMADSADLAEKILELKNNQGLREKIALNGYNLFQSQLRSDIIGKQLKEILNELCSKS